MLRGTARAVGRARKLRRKLTLPEGLLWRELRRRQTGPKFRKQHPAGPFVLDFACLEAKLAIEIDGEAHDRGNRPAQDEARDEWLANQGFRTLRIPAREVLADLGAVVAYILTHCHSSPERGGGPRPKAVVEGQFLPGTGRGTATRSGVVEGLAQTPAQPLHQPPPSAPAGPPPRTGEE